MPVGKQICLLTCLAFSLVGAAQEAMSGPDNLNFYFQQGQKDATLEQSLFFTNEQDELDYWVDQRIYEQALQKKSPREFTAYMLAKQLVYLRYAHTCSQTCEHGDYFHLQASYYSQFVTEDAEVVLWLQGFNNDNTIAGAFRH